ncbi:uncharacterized protein LOC110683535 [Chenopodium quinoa]|uniref:uncharacterized protein LOC110683535 n=1 Tax=Chenopodium quinoa TaxID=63459 RepID=UPI000B76E0EC|nr:uncharacterized protein LOC110683535 [Chenopodium quinoa]
MQKKKQTGDQKVAQTQVKKVWVPKTITAETKASESVKVTPKSQIQKPEEWQVPGKKSKKKANRQISFPVSSSNTYLPLIDDSDDVVDIVDETDDPNGGDGRIWVGWKAECLTLDVLLSTEQFIHYLLSTKDLQTQIMITFVKWGCCSEYETRDFQQCIDDLDLVEIKIKGSFFSWCNKAHVGPRTFSKIDRGFVNQEWINCYGHVEAMYLPPFLSDHNPIVYEIFHVVPGKGRPFRFLNCLTEHGSFFTIMETAWQNSGSENPMNDIWYKLKHVKTTLKSLNTQKFGDINAKLDSAQNHFNDIQKQISSDVTNTDLCILEMEAIATVKHWLGI